MNRTELTANERRTYRRQLREMNARLTGGVTQLESEALQPSGALAGGASPDPAVCETTEEVARTLLVSEEQLLGDVNAALERLTAGTFGKCEACGHAISRERLNAMPYARTCIRCAREGE